MTAIRSPERGRMKGDAALVDIPDARDLSTSRPVPPLSGRVTGVDEPDNPKSFIAAPDSDVSRQAVAIPFATATQRSFAAVADQFNALARFGSDRPTLSPADGAELTVDTRDRYEGLFIRDGFIQVDQHRFHDTLEFVRADGAIRAKAVALGYGAQAQAVAVTSVPGGYVGRFGGHDIYVATT